MVSVASVPLVSYIGQYLRDAGYDVAHLGHEMDLSDGLYANQENLEPLLAKTEGDGELAVLARLFFVCWPVLESKCQAALRADFLSACLECGLLVREDGSLSTSLSATLSTTALLIPYRSRIVACDSSRNRVNFTDVVTGPSGSTHMLQRTLIRGNGGLTLDLGTGTGVLALEAAADSNRVIGTDINPRALQFAAVNAALNAISNCEWRQGDAFEPVAGQRFSRIAANPPFFLSPVKTFTYCDSPMELDGFTARLARECAGYLEEGGFFQMLCEWVELEGQPSEERLRGWTSQSGCDVLVLLAPRLTPVSYAEKRAKEAHLLQASPQLEHAFADRLRYLTGHHVQHVMAGVITMRKRDASKNWFTVLSTETTGDNVGADLEARFDALTFLATAGEEEMFAGRFKIADGVVLEQRATAAEGEWQVANIELTKTSGLGDRLRLDEVVSQFLPLFDGHRALAEVAKVVAERLQIGLDEANRRCLQLVRRLMQSNFVTRQKG